MTQNYFQRVGVYVDASNMRYNGGAAMRYKALRQFACRDGAEPVRLNAYVSYDPEKAQEDYEYSQNYQKYYHAMRDCGYKVIRKDVRWYTDEYGNRSGKSNSDLDMAVDVLLQSQKLDRVLLVTGDGDFVQVVRALQNNGCRVEVLAFDNVSQDLKNEADMFTSGYLVPNLLPDRSENVESWGEIGSRMRGMCYHHDKNKSYGFLRFLPRIAPGIWNTDNRDSESPYATAFFHDSELPFEFNSTKLPSRDIIFEFTLREAREDKGACATDMLEV